jgi:small-conductance mechanosensitive channel
VVAVGDSGVTIRVRMKTLPLKQCDIAHGLRRRVKESFEDQGIEIPVVQPVASSKGDVT